MLNSERLASPRLEDPGGDGLLSGPESPPERCSLAFCSWLSPFEQTQRACRISQSQRSEGCSLEAAGDGSMVSSTTGGGDAGRGDSLRSGWEATGRSAVRSSCGLVVPGFGWPGSKQRTRGAMRHTWKTNRTRSKCGFDRVSSLYEIVFSQRRPLANDSYSKFADWRRHEPWWTVLIQIRSFQMTALGRPQRQGM
jgi:hypothetical protein